MLLLTKRYIEGNHLKYSRYPQIPVLIPCSFPPPSLALLFAHDLPSILPHLLRLVSLSSFPCNPSPPSHVLLSHSSTSTALLFSHALPSPLPLLLRLYSLYSFPCNPSPPSHVLISHSFSIPCTPLLT